MKDKVIVITGASSGLGKELSLQVSKLGAKVALVARRENLLKELKEKVLNEGGSAEYFVCDVTDFNQVKESVKNILEKFGKIDILVNGAGIYTDDEHEKIYPELIEKAFKVNSVGPIYFIKAVLPIMKKNNYGHIFNVISQAGLDVFDNKDWPTYTATKWAMTGYTKALQNQMLGTKVKVTGFYPYGFESNIFETLGEEKEKAHNQSWMMRVEDVAKTVVYALSQPDDLLIQAIGMTNV
ncbi:MAG: SDR family oxidoreductase [Candidatus Shapirobacteria bacterium]|jgi:NADP-dependent 3-hydroxy acid dehydrogenase YdfG